MCDLYKLTLRPRAFTGRRCPHSGRGEDFLTGQLIFFTETAVTPERKVENSFPRWEINRHADGYKWVIVQNRGHMAKIGFFGQKPKFWAKKRHSLFNPNHVLATTEKSCSKKKVAQIIKGKMTFPPLIIWAKALFFFEQLFPVVART